MAYPTPEYISDNELERRAIRLLWKHSAEQGWPVQLPVPITDVVEQTLGLRILYEALQEGPGEIILAEINPNYLGRPTIRLNELRMSHFDTYFGTEAFTLAHEAGHWVLHCFQGQGAQLAFDDVLTAQASEPVLCRALSGTDRRELQADRFAAYLLMPEELVLRLIDKEEIEDWRIRSTLARRCGVSRKAFTKRLVHLKKLILAEDGEYRAVSGSGEPRIAL